MVVRTKLRRVLRMLALYVGATVSIAYFAFHAFYGQHGIVAQRQYGAQKTELSAELEALQNERKKLEKQVALLKSNALDPDLLEEKARRLLGLTHPNDVVVMFDE